MNKALFLDRDGVINVNHGYVHLPEQFDFIEGIFDICRLAQERGFLIIVITNQAGIGRGYYSEKIFLDLTEWMKQRFKDEGVGITEVYFCPYHPEYGVGVYKRESFFRKPEPGMILAAAEDFDIDLSSSVLIGDAKTDIAAGMAAGVKTNILYDPENLELQLSCRVNKLIKAAQWVTVSVLT